MVERFDLSRADRPRRAAVIAVRSAFVFAVAGFTIGVAAAQSYPVRPIRLIVPFAAGGPVDGMARVLAPHLSAALKQSVVIDNRPGAAGLIGIEAGVRATPDGYTITMVSSSYSASAATLKLPYDPVNDVAPIVLVDISPQLAAVHPSVPIASVAELVSYAKANPGKLNYGSSGTGGSVHLSTEFLDMVAGIRMTHVPYKGQGPALNDLIGGQIQFLMGSPMVIYPHVKANRLRGIAITGGTRSSAMPEIPAFAETLPGYETYAWQAMLGPKALPKALIARWNTEMNRVLQLPEVKAIMARDGLEAGGGRPDRFFQLLKSDLVKWQKVVEYAHLKAAP
jgi:tripartite-type tricarboxylate transporter receptor subunit TctC